MLAAPPATAPSPSDSQKIIITSPKDGETLFVNDTVTVKWETVDDIVSVDVLISPNKGKSWLRLNNVSIPYYNTAQWSNFKWRIPETITIESHEFSLVNNTTVLFRTESYSPKNNSEISTNASPLSIKSRSEAVIPRRDFRKISQDQQVMLANEGKLQVLRFDCNGRAIGQLQQSSSGLIFEVISDPIDRSSSSQRAEIILNK